MVAWALKDAETSAKEVFERVFTGEPQIVTRHGVPSLVVITYADYEATPRMSVPRRGRRPARKSFVEFLRSCPVDNLGELIGERDRDTGANREQAFGEGTLA